MTILNNGYILDGMNEYERVIKRLFDFIAAVICFVICLPFTIYKFRSMALDAEKRGPMLSNQTYDKRLTNTGKYLRKHHLDELPQLWNVVKGDMSFVGPRPERQFYIDKIIKEDPRYRCLYQIRPGVTSYATLYNGYTDTMEKMLMRLQMDLYYLEHRSWWLDLRILSLTFLRISFGKKF